MECANDYLKGSPQILEFMVEAIIQAEVWMLLIVRKQVIKIGMEPRMSTPPSLRPN